MKRLFKKLIARHYLAYKVKKNLEKCKYCNLLEFKCFNYIALLSYKNDTWGIGVEYDKHNSAFQIVKTPKEAVSAVKQMICDYHC